MAGVILSAPVSAVAWVTDDHFMTWDIFLSFNVLTGESVWGFRRTRPHRGAFVGWNPTGLTVQWLEAIDLIIVHHNRFGAQFLRPRWFRPRRTIISQRQIVDGPDPNPLAGWTVIDDDDDDDDDE